MIGNKLVLGPGSQGNKATTARLPQNTFNLTSTNFELYSNDTTPLVQLTQKHKHNKPKTSPCSRPQHPDSTNKTAHSTSANPPTPQLQNQRTTHLLQINQELLRHNLAVISIRHLIELFTPLHHPRLDRTRRSSRRFWLRCWRVVCCSVRRTDRWDTGRRRRHGSLDVGIAVCV